MESDSSGTETIADTNRASDINLVVTTSLANAYSYGAIDPKSSSGKHLPVTLTVKATGGDSGTYKYRVEGLYEDDDKKSNVATKKSNPAVPLDFTDNFGPVASALTLPGPEGTGKADIEFFIPLKYFQYGSGSTPRLVIWLDVQWSVDGSSWPSTRRRRLGSPTDDGSRQVQEGEDEESMTHGTKEVGMAVDMVPMETDAGTVYQFKIVSVTALSAAAGAAALIL